ncbi:MAG: undecaprenyl-phosphate glucose phosphotransferase [Hyphomicrobium sp.]|nr:undecaprenyl-phosphate glucose phosphotransferase [Hyphomicrobium sp.]
MSSAPLIELPRLPPLSAGWSSDEGSFVSQRVVTGAVRIVDGAIVALVGLAIALAYVSEPIITRDADYALLLSFSTAVTIGVFQLLRLYDPRRLSPFLGQLPRVLLGWTITLAIVGTCLVFMKAAQDYSRVWLAPWYLAGGVGLIAGRATVSHLVRVWAREGRLYRRAVIYGAGPVSEEVIHQLENDPSSDIRISGIFDDRDEDGRAPRNIAGYPRLGGLTDLVSLGRDSRIDLVIVALPVSAEDRLSQIVKRLSVLPADIKLPARATSIRFSPKTYSQVGAVAMIDLYDKPIADWGTVSKWIFDKTIAGLALILLAPVMAAIALAIRLGSRGPVLFKQKRYGFNNELIEIYKFRSMYADRCDAAATKLVTKDDPRVTPIGRFLRRTSLDELPQLFNVLKGNLSLGPRPHAISAKADDRLYGEVVDNYFARHKVKPGITGWAQINGWRGETDTIEKILKRVEHDLYYIENWSVLFDLYILLMTPLSLLNTENAY